MILKLPKSLEKIRNFGLVGLSLLAALVVQACQLKKRPFEKPLWLSAQGIGLFCLRTDRRSQMAKPSSPKAMGRLSTVSSVFESEAADGN